LSVYVSLRLFHRHINLWHSNVIDLIEWHQKIKSNFFSLYTSAFSENRHTLSKKNIGRWGSSREEDLINGISVFIRRKKEKMRERKRKNLSFEWWRWKKDRSKFEFEKKSVLMSLIELWRHRERAERRK
jgi:hypothetical protein